MLGAGTLLSLSEQARVQEQESEQTALRGPEKNLPQPQESTGLVWWCSEMPENPLPNSTGHCSKWNTASMLSRAREGERQPSG